MFVRIATTKMAPDRTDQGIAAFEQQVVPVVRQQPGYLGAALLVVREAGESYGITYWESLDALNASEEMSLRRRADVTASIGATVLDVDRFEMVIAERAPGAEPRKGTYTRANVLYAQPERIDELISFMRERSGAVLQQEGCRALLMGVNRMTGRTFVNSVWDTAAHRDASEASVARLRQEASEVAGGEVRVTLGENAFVELRLPVPRS